MCRILEKCEWTTDSFAPAFGSLFPWIKTVKSVPTHPAEKQTNSYEREILNAPNGAILAIDWFDHPEEIAKKYHGLVVLINHGCTLGLSKTTYGYISEHCDKYDIGCCVVNLQGVNGVQATNSSIGTGLSMIVELKAITERIHQHLGANFPKSLVAMSVGGIPVIEYLSQDKLNYSSACVISTPLNLPKWCAYDSSPTRQCLESAKQMIKENSEILTKLNVQDVTRASSATTLSDLFAAMHTSNVSAWLNSLEPYARLDQITKPLMMFYALDDQSMTFLDDVDLMRLCRNQNIAVSVTEHGGHCEFKVINSESWIGQSVLEFISISLRPEF